MFKKYAEETMQFVKKIEADGPRLPGTDEEKAACVKIQKEINDRLGLETKTEGFTFAPRASIGGICYLGYAGLAAMVVYYVGGIYGTILAGFMFSCIMLFVALQVIKYTGTFDLFFKQENSSNIIAEMLPSKGETKYTVYLGAHYDSSWCWKLSLKNPKTAIPKTAYGLVGAIAMIGISVLRACNYFGVFGYGQANYVIDLCTMLVPIAIIPGLYFITQYVSGDKTIASPGAMDNLTGLGCNMMLMKYFKEHPEDMPEGMRIVYLGFGAEEASLKGSLDYVKRHKEEMLKEPSYMLNVDSIADPDYFEAIIGDLLQGTKFDSELIGFVHDTYKELGIKAKSIYNPVGGCDSTPFINAGIPTVTIAAQNPTTTYYYHTMHDKSERFSEDTLEQGLNVLYGVVKKIAAKEENK